MTAFVDDDEEDDDGDYNDFRDNYDLDGDGIFDNDDSIEEGEAYVCMAVIDEWDPQPHNVYRDDDILLKHGVFDDGGNPSIHPNYFSGTLNDSLGRPYQNDDPLTPTLIFLSLFFLLLLLICISIQLVFVDAR